MALLLVALAGSAFAGVAPAGTPAQASERHAAEAATESAEEIYFGRDSVALDAIDIALIARQAESLRGDPTLIVILHGYIEDLSSAAYGLAVGQRRLEAVRMALLSAGVPPRRIRTEIHTGDLANGAICADDDCRKRWRRVDIFLRR